MKKICYYLLIITILSQNSFAQEKKASTSMPVRQTINDGFADIVDELLPTVVNIATSQELVKEINNDSSKNNQFDNFKNQIDSQFEAQKKKATIGSGFIISKDGYIITNSHVVIDSREIIVKLHDGRKYKARIIGNDKKTDVALLKIDGEKDFNFVKLGNSDAARIGDWVIVIGNPYGLGSSVSIGIISARSRDINNNGQVEELIQTDAAINKGNSGGPMFNLNGEVIGIATSLFSPSGGSVGIGFATPITSVNQIIKQLKEDGSVSRSWIGISVQDINEEIAKTINNNKIKGAFVIEVTPNGPAEKAGIKAADLVIKIDNQDITDIKSLSKTISANPIGKVVKITVLRNNKIKFFDVTIEKLQDSDVKYQSKIVDSKKAKIIKASQVLDMAFNDLEGKNKEKGLVISEVKLNSEAAKKGIMTGDRIMSANQTPVNSVTELRNVILEAKKSTNKVFLFIKRGDKNYAIALTTN